MTNKKQQTVNNAIMDDIDIIRNVQERGDLLFSESIDQVSFPTEAKSHEFQFDEDKFLKVKLSPEITPIESSSLDIGKIGNVLRPDGQNTGNVIGELGGLSGVSSKTSNLISVHKELNSLLVGNHMKANYDKVAHLIPSHTYDIRTGYINKGNFSELAKVASPNSGIKLLATELNTAAHALGGASAILSTFVVANDTLAEINKGSDLARVNATYTASAAWNIGAAFTAAEIGCLYGLEGAHYGCAGGALVGVSLYTIADWYLGVPIVQHLSDKFEPVYTSLDEKKSEGKLLLVLVIEKIDESITNMLKGEQQPEGTLELFQIHESDEDSYNEVFIHSNFQQTDLDELDREAISTNDSFVPAIETLHTVASGDSLWSISQEKDILFSDLLEWNKDLVDPNQLQSGQEIRIAPPIVGIVDSGFGGEQVDSIYVVQSGDTVSWIAEQFGLSEIEFCLRNNINEDGDIQVGQQLDVRTPKEIAENNQQLVDALDAFYTVPDDRTLKTGHEEENLNKEEVNFTESKLSLEDQSDDSFLGLTSSQWKEINNTFVLAGQVEQLGADVSTILSAYEEGNDWDLFESSTDLLSSIDKLAAKNISAYNDMRQDYSGSINTFSSLVNTIGDIKNLEEAFSSGDGWGIASGTTSLLENASSTLDLDIFDNKNLDEFGTSSASSIVGLGLNVKEFSDILDEGDTTAKVQAALDVVESAISSYVAVTELSAAVTGAAVNATTQTLSSSLPAIGAAIGIAQGLVSILDGDAQGGSEQIALSVATYALCTIPVFGWAAALALQVASATRGCDGQIIDKENIEEFTDDLAPGTTEAVQSAIASVEVAAEWLTKAYDSSSYFSGFNLEMYEDLGVDIPEEMHAEFELAQTVLDASNPFRAAQYFQNLDELTLSDIWDSTYITQTIAATLKHWENHPDFVKSSFTDVPGVVADMVLSMANPDNLGEMVKNLFGNGDPPEASANFTIDENGNVVMTTDGDSSMLEITEAYGNPMIAMMQYYQDNGGRLEIDGTLPSLKVIQGEDSQINYQSNSGGKITVLLDDMSHANIKIQGILSARDHGERLDSAVQVAGDIHGNIDLAKVDAIMAGHGFVKKGITYTYGETRQRTGYSVGSGVIHGGGNVGPKGKHFTAKDTDITSLPLRTDQHPTQKMGDITKIVSLSNKFTSPGSELLAMSLGITSGVVGLASNAQGQDLIPKVNTPTIKALDSDELEKYLQGLNDGGLPQIQNNEKEVPGISWQPSIPELSDPEQLEDFLNNHWSDMVRGYGPMPNMPADSTYHYREPIGNSNLFGGGSNGPWLTRTPKDIFLEQQQQQQ